MILYEFRRFSKGVERAYLYGDSEEEALEKLHFTDICDHEDFEWTDWECVAIDDEEDE